MKLTFIELRCIIIKSNIYVCNSKHFQNFVVAVDDIKNVLFKRMCAPVGRLTRMECIGLRRDENIVNLPPGKFLILV